MRRTEDFDLLTPVSGLKLAVSISANLAAGEPHKATCDATIVWACEKSRCTSHRFSVATCCLVFQVAAKRRCVHKWVHPLGRGACGLGSAQRRRLYCRRTIRKLSRSAAHFGL
jgi:hypothetical protein